jgi:hypothetical protein
MGIVSVTATVEKGKLCAYIGEDCNGSISGTTGETGELQARQIDRGRLVDFDEKLVSLDTIHLIPVRLIKQVVGIGKEIGKKIILLYE